MRTIKKVWAAIACSALTTTILLGGANPGLAAEGLSNADKASAASLGMAPSEYAEVKELADKGQLEIWSNGKKFTPPQSSDVRVGTTVS